MTIDVLATLTAPTWRSIPFPITSLENGFTHEHVEHRFPYVDGQHIEAMGRNGLNFSARLPFNNGVRSGSFEPWAGQTLFPTLFYKFLNACLDSSSGVLLHPDFGPITCKARDVNWRYTSTLRDGAEISVRWYQSDDDTDAQSVLVAGASPAATATNAAASLDEQLATVGPLPELKNDTESFSSMVQNYTDGNSNAGRIQSKLDSTSAALDRMDDVSMWPLRQATEDLRGALFSLGGNVGVPTGSSGASVRSYTVPLGTSLASIGFHLGVRTDRLVSMNPGLARSPLVPPGTVVRYKAP